MIENWKDSLIPAGTTIRICMRVIDKTSLKTAFIINEKTELIGSVSDGDIRRALLDDASMDDPVKNIMNRTPSYCAASTTKVEIIDLLRRLDIFCVPLIADNRIVGIESIVSAQVVEKKENPVFIMAGGFGTRLRPLTDNCPKPMLPVGKKPMLEHIVERLIQQGFVHFIFSTHFLPEVIKKHFGDGSQWGIEIDYVYEVEPLGTAGALSMLPSDLPKLPLIVLNGDVLTDLNFNKLLEHHVKYKLDATMCLREIEHKVSYGVVEVEQGEVMAMVEKPTFRHKINTGIYVLSPACYGSVEKNRLTDMPSLLLNRVSEGKRVGAVSHAGYWLDIGRIADYEKAQKDISSLI